jgi:hypothetical protein
MYFEVRSCALQCISLEAESFETWQNYVYCRPPTILCFILFGNGVPIGSHQTLSPLPVLSYNNALSLNLLRIYDQLLQCSKTV